MADEPLSSFDKQAMALALTMDSPERKRAYQEALLEKWEGKKNGVKVGSDWLGKESEERGFPALRTEHSRLVMATLLENQFRFQRSQEIPVHDGRVLIQGTATSDEALPTKFALPIVRRVYALMIQNDWSVVQPLPGPTGYVFWLDFIREADTTNVLSVEYTALQNSELSVPVKGKLQLQRATLTVIKQIMGMSWSLEALEDARAQLGIDVEQELLNAFGLEFVRNLFGRHLKNIMASAISGIATGSPSAAFVSGGFQPWSGPNTLVTIAGRGTTSVTDYKSVVYNALIDADTNFQKANRTISNGIVAGYGMAGFLQKLLTATQAQSADSMNMNQLGITDYGTFAGRWRIWATDFLNDDQCFLYLRNPDQLHAAHIYAPYIPIQVMPAIYGDYNTSTGAYLNQDAYTRNIRERSADIVTKPYAFAPVKGPAGLAF